jgi:hypothetical protein
MRLSHPSRSATYWKVGPYILMPDHLHLFAWPGILHADFDGWVRYWKSQFSNSIDNRSLRWQSGRFHHRLGSCESAEAKRLYMVNNPVRAGLVTRSEEWPLQGQIFSASVGGECCVAARTEPRPTRSLALPAFACVTRYGKQRLGPLLTLDEAFQDRIKMEG